MGLTAEQLAAVINQTYGGYYHSLYVVEGKIKRKLVPCTAYAVRACLSGHQLFRELGNDRLKNHVWVRRVNTRDGSEPRYSITSKGWEALGRQPNKLGEFVEKRQGATL